MSKETQQALNSPKVERTHKQETIIFDYNWVRQKIANRRRNLQIAHGRVAQSTGLHYLHTGQPRKK